MQFRRLYTSIILLSIVLFATQCQKTTEGSQQQTEANVTLNTANNKSVGSSARELLSADKPNLVVEINYMTGYPLESATLDYVKSYLSTYTNKTSFELVQKEIPVSGKDSLSIAEIDKLERQYRTTFNSARQVSVYILITDGIYNPANTLGFAFRNTSVTLFGKTIKSNSGGLFRIAKWKLEATTLEHELGHIMGLVNLGTPMITNHEDDTHKGHCNNKSCLMYWQTETGSYLNTNMNAAISPLDVNCHNDIIAMGGK
jgi:hypothetical protein